jgi:hypothetical protein
MAERKQRDQRQADPTRLTDQARARIERAVDAQEGRP